MLISLCLSCLCSGRLLDEEEDRQISYEGEQTYKKGKVIKFY